MLNSEQMKNIDITINGLKKHYKNGDFSPRELLASIKQRIEQDKNNPVFIHVLSDSELELYLSALAGKGIDLPLYGVPFAIKDNIDLAGINSTAACPAFSYTASESALVVQRLIDAGAIPVGKTNMDQFATGLVGVRSPWGACKNALNPEYISGGSSSGSAVSVAKAWVSFSLGTDTAGSGRVPASLNNIVGLKPSCGLLSNSGVVPACKSIDCVSIFALTAADAAAVLDVAAAYDIDDPYSRQNTFENGPRSPLVFENSFSFGVPSKSQLNFFGNEEAEQLFDHGIEVLKQLGGKAVEIDFSAFLDAARLLYEGPWVAERYLAMQDILQKSPDDVLPVIRAIVESSGEAKATEAYSAYYKLNALKQYAIKALEGLDCVITPTNGTFYTIAQLEADPIQLNSNLGYYTNFMNLLDFSAVSVPVGFYEKGLGFGVTLFAKAFEDKKLLSLAAKIQESNGLTLGASDLTYSAEDIPSRTPQAYVDVAVCGAHLEGFPLNWQLLERGAVKRERLCSSKSYRLYALAGGPPFRPGMLRDEKNGEKIVVELWRMEAKQFGSFVSNIPAPLGIGKLELEDGRWVTGFICEPYALQDAEDITSFGGWKAYMESRNSN